MKKIYEVKLAAKKAPKVQVGEGAISPQIKLAATKAPKTQFGEGVVSAKIKLALASR